MKKVFIVFSAVLLTLVACNKEIPVEPTEATKLAFNIQINHPEDTKTVKTAWEYGDKVYVFFEGLSGEGKYLTLFYNGTSWNSELNSLEESDFSSDIIMHAVFFPFEQPEIATSGTGFTFKTKSEGHTAATAGLGIYTYYMTGSTKCFVTTVGETKTLSGTLSMALPSGYVQFYIPAAGSKYNADYTYRLSIEGVKPTACVSYNAAFAYGQNQNIAKEENDFSAKELVAAQPMWGYKYGDGIAFSGVIDETWDSSTNHIIYFFDTGAAAKTITINESLNSHDAVKLTSVASWTAAAKAPDTVTSGGIKWGTFHLGAASAGTDTENYGWYFLWGDIIPARSIATAPTNYARTAYFYNTIAYEALAGKKVNLTENYAIYDMATAFLGSPWRMPTGGDSGELKALFDLGVTYEVGAVIVNDALLTIPMAGYWYYNNSTDNKYEHAGTRYNVWSSTYDTKIVGNACGVSVYNHVKDINSEYTWRQVKSSDQCNRMNGNSVLPVQDAD